MKKDGNYKFTVIYVLSGFRHKKFRLQQQHHKVIFKQEKSIYKW